MTADADKIGLSISVLVMILVLYNYGNEHQTQAWIDQECACYTSRVSSTWDRSGHGTFIYSAHIKYLYLLFSIFNYLVLGGMYEIS